MREFDPKRSGCNRPVSFPSDVWRLDRLPSKDSALRRQPHEKNAWQMSRLVFESVHIQLGCRYEYLLNRWSWDNWESSMNQVRPSKTKLLQSLYRKTPQAQGPDRSADNQVDLRRHNAHTIGLDQCSQD